MEPERISIVTADGLQLAARRFHALDPRGSVVVGSATGVPQGFYRRFAEHMADAGWTTTTFDYRGIGESAPPSLRGFEATMADWGLLDLPAAVRDAAGDGQVFVVGHSVGGQVLGLTPEPEKVAGLVGVSAQSGHWRHQGGNQRLAVWFHAHVTLPLLPRIVGYAPWSRFAAGEDLPAGVARQWGSWSRDPDYLLGDESLPLERYERFTAPVLAYSIDDDDWGTARSVDSMMRAYRNVERRHVSPADLGVDRLGHMGAFRAGSDRLWDEIADWLATR